MSGKHQTIVTLDHVVDSLHRRGFYTGADIFAVQTQIFAVAEELGELSRMFRRLRQRGDNPGMDAIQTEAADVAIAALCLAACACGSQLSDVVAAKLEADEKRGVLHGGCASE